VSCLGRLYKWIEHGLAEINDLLRDRIADLNWDRDRSRAALVRAKTERAHPFTLASW